MRSLIKQAFDSVKAEETLKESTKAFIKQSTSGLKPKRKRRIKWALYVPSVAAACLVIAVIIGNWLYFVPAFAVSVDINPSIELEVNRFDKVISVNTSNEDGKQLASEIDIKHKSYLYAVNAIIDSESVSGMLSNGEIICIGVIGDDGKKTEKPLSLLKACTANRDNTHCFSADKKELRGAHEKGLSYGKYDAYLKIQERYPEVSIEEVKEMSMREVCDMLDIRPDAERCKGDHGEGSHGKGHSFSKDESRG